MTLRVAIVGTGPLGLSAALWLRHEGHEAYLFGRPPVATPGPAALIAPAGILPEPAPRAWESGALTLPAAFFPSPFRQTGFAGTQRFDRGVGALDALLSDAVAEHRLLAGRGRVRSASLELLYHSRDDFLSDAPSHALRMASGHPMTVRTGPADGADIALAASLPGHAVISDVSAWRAALYRRFIRRGGHAVPFEVLEVSPDGGGVSITGGNGQEKFDRAVIAGGVWSRKLARRLGHRLPLDIVRGHRLQIEGVSHSPGGPVMLMPWRASVVPGATGLTLDYASGFGIPPRRALFAPYRTLRDALRTLWPEFQAVQEHRWMGDTVTTPDGLPVIGPCPGAPAIVLAAGFRRIGVTAAPKAGRLVAAIISSKDPGIALEAFRPERFD